MKLLLHVHTQDRSRSVRLNLRSRDAWEEEKHPRGKPNNAGQFTSKGSGSGGKTETETSSSSRSAPSEAPSSLPKKPPILSPTKQSLGSLAKYRGEVNKILMDSGTDPHPKSGAEKIRAIVPVVCKAMGIDTPDYKVEDLSDFTLNGQTLHAAGYATSDSHIALSSTMAPEIAAAVACHEAMHLKFARFMSNYNNEMDKMGEDSRGPREIMYASGRIKEDAQKDYPLHTLVPINLMNGEDLRKDDGITDYSRKWWKAVEDGTGATIESAVNETLAEMAFLNWRGELPNMEWYQKSKSYKPLFQAIHTAYPDLRPVRDVEEERNKREEERYKKKKQEEEEEHRRNAFPHPDRVVLDMVQKLNLYPKASSKDIQTYVDPMTNGEINIFNAPNARTGKYVWSFFINDPHEFSEGGDVVTELPKYLRERGKKNDRTQDNHGAACDRCLSDKRICSCR